MLTFDDEVKYIWPNPWTPVKFIYFFVRYFAVVLHITIQFLGTPPFTFTERECYIWNVYQALASALLIASVDYILILRIFALYPRTRIVRIAVASLYAVEVITIAIGFGLSVPNLVYDEYCTVVDSPITFLVAAAAPIAFQAVLFGLTIWKFLKAVKAGWGDVPLVKLLMRDGTWAFFLLFVVFVAEALLYAFAPDAYTSVLYGWLNTAFAFCGYRILINLNYTGRNSRPTSANFTTGPNIQFTTHIYTGHDIMVDQSYPMAVITRSDERMQSETDSSIPPRPGGSSNRSSRHEYP
ncbi:hypothetical protein CC1G_09276 [Coprinopsis cinerea okayama7|uniref:DUF6533 domain-containing protein n=1 Tax=Coprinopsis cinerea (strain Okayama-7 / 130 / ATCC MYA-4618 / FGSC 9003) TaxID=240176 RepID=A8N855_COPC7|nr:hypothetical protein CC1G_09276 [Coprinopsis cinerea okayama7\|eukprot:XP_001831011.1 hypothetical protein CC1G_09276 [Coprinopsis cinerea okayama7\